MKLTAKVKREFKSDLHNGKNLRTDVSNFVLHFDPA